MKRFFLFLMVLLVTFSSVACCEEAAPETDSGSTPGMMQNRPNSNGMQKTPFSFGSQNGPLNRQSGSSSVPNMTATVVLVDQMVLSGETYTATLNDESVLQADGGVEATLTDVVLKKTSGIASDQYAANTLGVNAAARIDDNSSVFMQNVQVESTADSANGVFVCEDGVVQMVDSSVSVTGKNAGALYAVSGGSLYGTNLTVAAANGTAIHAENAASLILDGGSYVSNGRNGSPAIYSGAEVVLRNATGTATNSRVITIEGGGSVTIENSVLTGNDQSMMKNGTKANILLQQSGFVSAEKEMSVLTIANSKITAQSGAMFSCMNTNSTIHLTQSELVLSGEGNLLNVASKSRGPKAQGSSECTFNASSQTLNGNITVDNTSLLALNLTGSTYNGAIMNEGTTTVTLDASSKWILSGDSSVTAIVGDPSCIDLNGYTLLVNGTAYVE